MGVDFKNAQYKNSLADWVMVRTLCEGDSAVKKAGETLLPNPAIGTGEPAVQAAAIYERYKQRAAFFNVTGRTAQSLIGSVFRKPPTLVVPQNIEPITYDIDGAGVSIYQQSQSVLFDVLATGRAGLLVDYPSVDVAASAADVAAGVVRPIVAKYTAEQILNWRHERIGGQSVLSLVTLCEDYAKESDDYSEEYDKQIRALRLIGGVYVVEIHRKNSKGEWVIVEIFTPKQRQAQRGALSRLRLSVRSTTTQALTARRCLILL